MPFLKPSNRLGILIGVLFLLVALLFTSLPSHGANDSDKDSSDNRSEEFQSRINEFINDGLDFKLGKTIGEIKQALGQPQKSNIRKVENRHYPQIDEIHELYYQGLYMQIYKVSATRKEFITNISISSDRYKLKWGLNVGSQKSAVKRVLGSPDKNEKNLFEYCDDITLVSCVSFHFSNEIVRKVDWDFYSD
jgi:hypothetical protein